MSRATKAVLVLAIAALCCFGQFSNAKKLGGKPPCSATVTTNCIANVDGSGVAIGGGGGDSYLKLTIPYSDAIFQTAATSVSKAFGSALPANAIIRTVVTQHSAAFAGTGVTSVTASVGRSLVAQATDYAPAFDVYQTASSTAFWSDVGAGSKDLNTHTPYVWLTANTNFGNGSASVLTAGSVTVWIFYITLP